MKTIAQLLREFKSFDIPESILKDIELIEEVNLRKAYRDALVRVQFEEWYESNFHTMEWHDITFGKKKFDIFNKTNQNENH
jgi:HEPN domain-containing protein